MNIHQPLETEGDDDESVGVSDANDNAPPNGGEWSNVAQKEAARHSEERSEHSSRSTALSTPAALPQEEETEDQEHEDTCWLTAREVPALHA